MTSDSNITKFETSLFWKVTILWNMEWLKIQMTQ